MGQFDGKKLRERREALGLGHLDVALKCGEIGVRINPQTIRNWEAGIYKNPNIYLLKGVADVLGVDHQSFFS